ncbi:major facilitator superfamily transporter [Colletotrichum higginsianum]|nr:major facilitator superfamily transporter [Colletotrichum higginsianum]
MSDTATQSEKNNGGGLVLAPVHPDTASVDAEAAHSYVIDPAAEARLVRKQDLRVLPMVFLMYFFTFLDRTNLGNAKVAGMEADLGLGTYVVSRFYRRSEVTTRVSFFMLGAAGLASAFGGLLASGLLSLGSIGSVSSWRNIFLVEGIITVGVGIISLYLFPADPSKTRIFNEEERSLAMARIFHDQPAIREHKEKITWGLIKRGVVNVNVLVGAWIYICDQITVQGLSIFTVTILRLNYPGRSTVEIQLLSVPPPLFGMVFGLGVAYVTMKTRKHGVAIAMCAALNVIGYSIWLASTNAQARYAAIFLNTAGGFSFGTLVLSWTLANAAPDTVRNVANGAVSGLANIGSITATWSYINTDAKTGYRIGNSLNTATAVSVIIASLGLVVHQKWENKKRAQGGRDYRLETTEEEVATLGHLHPEFRYIH